MSTGGITHVWLIQVLEEQEVTGAGFVIPDSTEHWAIVERCFTSREKARNVAKSIREHFGKQTRIRKAEILLGAFQ